MHDTNIAVRAFRCLPPLALALLAGACSTVTQGTSQEVMLTTPGVQDAVCVVAGGVGDNLRVTPPAPARWPTRTGDVQLSCSVAGRPETSQVVVSRYAPRSRFQHPVGYVVDGASGAMWVYPDVIEVSLGDAQQRPADPLPEVAPVPRPTS